ncbi:unnamed protein product, partial [Schistosoma rodhaini]
MSLGNKVLPYTSSYVDLSLSRLCAVAVPYAYGCAVKRLVCHDSHKRLTACFHH